MEELREESSNDCDSRKHNTVSSDDTEYREKSLRRRKIGHQEKESKEIKEKRQPGGKDEEKKHGEPIAKRQRKKRMVQERNALSGQGLSKVKDQDEGSIQIDQPKLAEITEKEKKVKRTLGKSTDLEEQSRSVSNTDKRKDRTRSKPSTSVTGSKENVNLQNAISYLEKYSNIRECEGETKASNHYNEESDKEQIASRTGSGWQKDTYTNGFEEDQVKVNKKEIQRKVCIALLSVNLGHVLKGIVERCM